MLITVETVGKGGIHVFAQLFCGSKTVIFNLSFSSSSSSFFFLAVPHVMWDLSTLIGDLLVPQPGLEPMPPASEAQSLNYWTIRKVSKFNLLMSIICLKKKRSFEIRNIQAWILIPPFSCGTLDGSLILLENRDNNASLIYHDISWYNIPSN